MVTTSPSRSVERTLFSTTFDTHASHSVIVFHGPEGIGKSWLRTAITTDLQTHVRAPISITLDFGYPELREPTDGLLAVRRQLSDAAKGAKTFVPTRAFDLAITAYYQLRHSDEKARHLAAELARLSDDPMRKGIRVVGDFTAQVVPVGGDYVQRFVDWGLAQGRRREAAQSSALAADLIQLIPRLDADAVAELLPRCLATDIDKYLQDNPQKRVLLVLDNYEQLWGPVESAQLDQTRKYIDEWVRGLVAHSALLTTLIFGRTPLAWPKQLFGKEPWIEQRRLEPLDQYASVQLLKDHGVDDEKLASIIAENTYGSPLWLKLVAEEYRRTVAAGKSFAPLQLSSNPVDMASRALKGLTADEQRTAKHLAAVTFFDRALFVLLTTGTVATGTPAAAFDEFVKLSFIEAAAGEEYSIHAALRIPLLAKLRAETPELLEALKHIQQRYWSGRGLKGHTNLLGDGLIDIHRVLRGFMQGTVSEDEVRTLFAGPTIPQTHRQAQVIHNELADFQRRLHDLRNSTEEAEKAAMALRDSGRDVGDPSSTMDTKNESPSGCDPQESGLRDSGVVGDKNMT